MQKLTVICLLSLFALASAHAAETAAPLERAKPAASGQTAAPIAPAPSPAVPATPPAVPMGQAPTPAAPISTEKKGKGACREDMRILCAGVEKGGGRMMKCLNEHADQLSPDCKAARARKKEIRREIKSNCQADIQRLCSGAKRGGALLDCLASNTPQLSPGCAKVLGNQAD